MATPNTGGQLRTKIADMQVGDYIQVRHHYNSSNKIHLFEYWGNPAIATLSEMPVTGRDKTASQYVAKAYFIKVDKGLLICDRIVTNTISWDELNSSDYIEGKTLEIKIDSINFVNGGGYSYFNQTGIIRSLGGGNKRMDTYAMTALPADNEFDVYLKQSNLNGMITPNDPAVWHHDAAFTWTQDTPDFKGDSSLSSATAGSRVLRHLNNGGASMSHASSSLARSDIGFRPVFEYQEVTP